MAAASFTISHKVTLTTEECIKCGVSFALPEEFRANLHRTGGFFYCPAGHGQGWDEGEDERKKKDLKTKLEAAQKELDAERKRKEWAEQDARNQANIAKKAQTELANLTKRTHAGVCPCCNRTFKQLAAHMKNKHPTITLPSKAKNINNIITAKAGK